MTDSQNQTDSNPDSENTTKPGIAPTTSGGPINLEQIRLMREAQQVRMQQDQKRQNRDKPPKARPPRDPAAGTGTARRRTQPATVGTTEAIRSRACCR